MTAHPLARWRVLALAVLPVLAALGAACVLNPHPLPPLEASGQDAGVTKGVPAGDASAYNGADASEAADAVAPVPSGDADASKLDAAGDAADADKPDGVAADGGFDAGDAPAPDATAPDATTD